MILWDNLSSLFPRETTTTSVSLFHPSMRRASERVKADDSYVVNVNRDGAVRCNGTEAMSCIASDTRTARVPNREPRRVPRQSDASRAMKSDGDAAREILDLRARVLEREAALARAIGEKEDAEAAAASALEAQPSATREGRGSVDAGRHHTRVGGESARVGVSRRISDRGEEAAEKILTRAG